MRFLNEEGRGSLLLGNKNCRRAGFHSIGEPYCEDRIKVRSLSKHRRNRGVGWQRHSTIFGGVFMYSISLTGNTTM